MKRIVFSKIICWPLSALMIVFFGGCAIDLSYDQIVSVANQVDASDGVRRMEAQRLAQKFVIEHNLDQNHDVYDVTIKGMDDNKGLWLVEFASRYDVYSRKGYQGTLRVWVDEKTGLIQHFDITKN